MVRNFIWLDYPWHGRDGCKKNRVNNGLKCSSRSKALQTLALKVYSYYWVMRQGYFKYIVFWNVSTSIIASWWFKHLVPFSLYSGNSPIFRIFSCLCDSWFFLYKIYNTFFLSYVSGWMRACIWATIRFVNNAAKQWRIIW